MMGCLLGELVWGLVVIGNPTRRTFMTAAASALVLSGCRPGSDPTPSPTAPPGAQSLPSAAPTASAPDVVPAPVTPAPAPSPTPLVTKQHVVDQFSGLRPSYWGLEAPGVLQTLSASAIGLTLDYCGGPGGSGVDYPVLEMLQRYEVPATLFMNSRWIEANPVLARDLAAVPFFELANHGTGHLPLSVNGNSAYGIPGTRNCAGIYDEIMGNDQVLAELTGERPRFFRPGTAYLDNVATQICHALDVVPAGFSVNADGGATFPAATVADIVGRAQPGDVIICHGNQPRSGTGAGLIKAVPQLLDKGYILATLGAGVP